MFVLIATLGSMYEILVPTYKFTQLYNPNDEQQRVHGLENQTSAVSVDSCFATDSVQRDL